MINISFHGAARTVTGSRHFIDVDGFTILLDCGLFQGRRSETYERNLNFSFYPRAVDSAIISHAHMDHLGNVPNLVKRGYFGDIHCTLATADLANIMLTDSANIQVSDIEFVNKIRRRRGEPEMEPLYTVLEVQAALKHLQGHSYDRTFNLRDNISATFHDAGHILGSAITVLDITESERKTSICFTGDLGRYNMPIIRDPEVITDSDILIIESTYGDRLHADIKNVQNKLEAVINETIDRGGKIIVPSFALERTQELVYNLHELKLAGRIPDIPVYVDSPLAVDATDIFRAHPECYDDETARFLRETADPFGFRGLHYVSSAAESKKLNQMKTPSIIISASGMAEAGRILHHLRNNISNPNNTVLIVGWQAENTLGRKIREKWPEVTIFGEAHKLRCRVEVFEEFSAHADRNDLLKWVSAGKDRWKQVYIVHGEETAALSLADDFRDMGIQEVVVPELGQSFII